MVFEIVEIDPAEMHRTALITRAKSPRIRALYEALFSLQKGEAKAAVVEPGEDLTQIRNMVANCAARANVELQIVVDRVAQRVLFTHKPSRSQQRPLMPSSATSRTPEELVAMEERREKIREAALTLGRERPQISAQEVIDHLRDNGIRFDVPRPATAASAVIRNMSEFERVGQSRFAYRG
jgi:hypothetical protein